MSTNLFSMKQAAALLKVPPYKIAYLLNMGRVPEPETWISNRRAFSAADIKRLAERLNVPLSDDFPNRKEEADG